MTHDMSQIIQPKSDQINADDMISGPMTVTIDAVNISPRDDQPISIRLQGMTKVFRPCKSMSRVMVQAWGPDASKYAGRSLTLYRDPKVKWGGLEVGGIRISHMSHINAPLQMMLTHTRSQRAPFKVSPLAAVADAPSAPDNALELAQAAAGKGTEAFRAWWTSEEGKACRSVAQENIDALKKTSAEVDALKKRAAEADAPPIGDDEPPM